MAGDPSLADQFQMTLESLKRRCRESPHQLAALVYGTEQVLKGDGVNESYATVLSSLDTAVPSNARRFDCRGVLAALVVLREKG